MKDRLELLETRRAASIKKQELPELAKEEKALPARANTVSAQRKIFM